MPWPLDDQPHDSGADDTFRKEKAGNGGSRRSRGSFDIALGARAGIPIFCVLTSYGSHGESMCDMGEV